MKLFRRRPSLATAGIAETVVLSQLRSIIQSAAKIAAYRNSKVGHFFNVSLHMNVPCVVLRKFNGTSTKLAAVDLHEKLRSITTRISRLLSYCYNSKSI